MNATVKLSLDPEMLEDWAGSEIFNRGEQLLNAVTITTDGNVQVDGFVKGTHRYDVSFRMDGDRIQACCSCPHAAGGNFCKHLVAFGLVIIDDPEDVGVLSFDDDAFESEPRGETASDPVADHVQSFLDGLDWEELYGLIEVARMAIPPFEELLQHLAGPPDQAQDDVVSEDVESHIKNLITDVCRVGPFVDYYRAGELADELIVVLEEIEAFALAGHQKILVKQSRRLVDRISKILESTDDSNGFVGEVLDRATALHAFICITGEANPDKLVDWIIKVQLKGPGWPDIDIAEYWPILTDRSKQKYRSALEAALDVSPHDGGAGYSRWLAATHLVQFADASGDVDLAVKILEGNGDVKEAYYRLVRSGRTKDADVLFETMLGEWKGIPGHRLSTGEIVDVLLSSDRVEEAEKFARKDLGRQQTLENYLLLVKIGEHTGRDLRAEARELVSDVLVLQNVLIHEGDTDSLWELVFTREHNWIPDATVGYFENNDPDRALKLLIKLGMETAGGNTTKSVYAAAAGYFKRAKRINPASVELSRAIADVRETYARRTNMLKIFDKQGL